MNMVTIVCPKCSAQGKLSLVDSNYTGPRRCWKCHELFTITIVNNQVRSSEPLSEEEYQKQQEIKKAKEKAGGGSIEFSSSRPEPERPAPQSSPEKFNRLPPAVKEEPEKPATKSPPERFRVFIPPESLEPEPEKPAPKNPPERFRTFIPPAT
jgi:hypothetical protein